MDITNIPMPRGFLYLVAIMDWYSRKVLNWRLSNSMEADFCVEALNEAITKYRILTPDEAYERKIEPMGLAAQM